MATLKDVAKLACVDVSTVSRALNNTSYVHPDTTAKIYAAAKELGYHPNVMAQALRQGRRHTIGVVVPRLHLAIFSEILQGIEAEAQKLDYTTMVCVTEDDPKVEKDRLNRLRNETLSIINERLTGGDESELGVPLGSVFLPALLSGKGPRLPVRVLTVSNCDADFYSGFREAGINQTLHRITMQVAMNITLLTPAGTQQVKVDSGVVVAETILIGQVPQPLIRPQE